MSSSPNLNRDQKVEFHLLHSMRFRIWSSFSSLFMFIVAFGIIAINFGIPFLDIKGYRDRMFDHALISLNDVADLKKAQLNEWVREKKSDLLSYSTNPILGDFIEKQVQLLENQKLNKPKNPDSLDHLIGASLKKIQASHFEFLEVFIYSKTANKVLFSTEPTQENRTLTYLDRYFSQGAHNIFTFIEDPKQKSHFKILIGRPIEINNAELPYWVFIIVEPESFLSPLLHTNLGLGATGETLLVNSKSEILNGLKHPLPDGSIPEILKFKITAEPATLAAQGSEGIIQSLDYRGKKVIAAFRHLRVNSENHWGMVVKKDVAEVMQPIANATNYSILIGLIGILFSGLFARIITNSIMTPLVNLSVAAGKVKDGDLTARADVKGKDELAYLGDTINQMIDKIEISQEQLNFEVNIRTKELQDANLTLEEMMGDIREKSAMLEDALMHQQLIFDNATIGIAFIRDRKFYKFNEKLSKIFGYSEKELKLMDTEPLYAIKGDFDRVGKEAYPKLISGEVFSETLRLKRRNGSSFWGNLTGKAIDPKNLTRGSVWIMNDVSDQIQYQESLLEATEQARQSQKQAEDLKDLYHQFFETNTAVKLVIDPEDGKIQNANGAASKFYGYSKEELTSMNIQEINQLEPEKVFSQMQPAESEKTKSCNFVHKLANGELRDVAVYSGPIVLNGRHLLYSIIHDITEQQRSLEQLILEKRFTESILEGVDDTIFMLDPSSGRAVRWNSAVNRITGYSDEEIALKKAPDDWYEPADILKATQVNLNLQKDEIARIEMGLITKSGDKIPTEYRSTLIPNETGDGLYLLSVGRDLRDRIEAEKELHQKEQQAQSYLDVASVLMFALDASERVTLINKKGCDLLGYSEEEILGKNWFDHFLVTEDIAQVKQVYQQLMTGEVEPVEYFENEIKTKSGKLRLIEWHNSAVKDDKGEVIGIFSSGLDITEREKVKKALDLSNEMQQQATMQYSATFDLAPIGIAMVATDGRFLETNPRWGEIIGYSKEEMGLKTFQEITHPDDLDKDLEFVRQMLAGERQHYTMEKRYFHKNGNIVWISLTVSLLKKANGEPDFFISIISDITEQRKIKEALAYSEEQLRTLITSSQDAIVTIDKKSDVIFWNDGATQIFGYSAAEMVSQPLARIMPEKFKEGHSKGVSRVVKGGKSKLTGKPLELVGLTKDNREIPIELSLSQWEMRGEVYFSGIMRDITLRKESESETLRLTNAIDQIEDIIFITNLEGDLLFCNPAFKDFPKVFPSLLFEETCLLEKTCTYDDPLLISIFNSIEAHEPWRGEWSVDTEEASFRYFDFTISPQFNDQFKIETLTFIGIETTEKRKAQANLIQSQKMESLGTLAGGVAHEINNPIGYISSNLQTLELYMKDLSQTLQSYSELEGLLPSEGPLFEAMTRLKKIKKEKKIDLLLEDYPDLLAEVNEGIGRVKSIVKNLRDFSHSDMKKLGHIDINKALKQTLKIAWNELKYRCEIIEDYGDLPLVECYPQQINQVFLNLVINAAQAIKDKGTITIRTQFKNGKVHIEIQDTGVGIAPTSIPKLFEPFFTTKEVGKGTGLGLSVSYNIVKDHEGEITVNSTLGIGTSFSVTLPLKQKHPTKKLGA